MIEETRSGASFATDSREYVEHDIAQSLVRNNHQNAYKCEALDTDAIKMLLTSLVALKYCIDYALCVEYLSK